MRLLIVTQAVDLDDPVLGFFHRWIEEFAKKSESIHVICLKEGRHTLPAHVHLHSLGKESGRSRLKYIVRFYRYIWSLRHEYDVVFVHMNPEYVVLGGLFWRAWKKRIGLWFIHPRRSFSLRLALRLANVILSATKESVPLPSGRLVAVGVGIDTGAFVRSPASAAARTILSLGRLDSVKRVDVLVKALSQLHDVGIAFSADIYGSPTDRKSDYAHDLRNLMTPLTLEEVLSLHEAVPNNETPAIYGSHAIFVNLTETGSFDKAIVEALAAGCVVVVANESFRGVIPLSLMSDGSVEGTARAIKAALELTSEERTEISKRNRSYAEEHFALSRLVPRIIAALQ